jgi:NodT family efflux transporter outer membrane factor (OMF) lipoprotein
MCKRLCSLAALAWLVAGASGCVPALEGSGRREPRRTLPARFEGGDGTSSGGASVGRQSWRDLLASPELRSLIEAALANNQELNARVQEIIIARAEVMARQGEVLPRMSAAAGAGIEKVGRHTSQGRADEANGVAEHLPDFVIGLRASWEVDVWNRLRNAVKAADLRVLSTMEARNFLVTEIVAELGRSYYELVAVDNQLDILNRNIGIQRDALEVVRLQKQAARATELAVQRFEAEVLKNQSRLYDLQQEQVQLENRINFLVGRFPQPVRRDPRQLMAPVSPTLQAGLPFELLENRPDVRRAELELAAAALDVKVAKAAFYPSLSIDAAVGYRAFNAAHLLATPASLFYDLAGGLTAPLLNRKGIEAQYRSADARQVQAVLTYERTVLEAFTDVVNQLARLSNLQKTYDLQAQQVETLSAAVEVSNVLFQSARADYMEVLLTRRDSLDAQMELVETKKRQFEAVVDVYRALGGGWRPGS